MITPRVDWWIATLLACAGAAGGWYFVAAYWWLTRGSWRRLPGGRHVMGFTASLALLLTLVVINRFGGDYPGRVCLTIVVFAALVVQVFWRCVLLHRAQRPSTHDTHGGGS